MVKVSCRSFILHLHHYYNQCNHRGTFPHTNIPGFLSPKLRFKGGVSYEFLGALLVQDQCRRRSTKERSSYYGDFRHNHYNSHCWSTWKS